MNQKNNQRRFEKNVKTKMDIAPPNNDTKLIQKRENIKKELIKKYGIPENSVENVLKKLENKSTKENYHSSKKINTNYDTQIETTSEKNKNYKQKQNRTTTETISLQEKQQNVDQIISDIIPNYNEHPVVELDNVSLTFDVYLDKIDTLKELFIRTLKREKPSKIKFKALQDITFKIYKGEKIGVIGYNGAGKSTLLNVISGIYPPDSGKVKTYGTISPLLSLGAGFDYNYSGRRNIFLNGAVLGYDKKFLENKVDEIIEFSELEEFIDFPIKNYSSGMIAKLGFSIATAVNPDILIIDEILGVGDVNFQKKSGDKIRSLMNDGTTVILVSHSTPQIRELCDKAIWIDKGKIREMGDVNTVCDNYLKDSERASKDQIKNIQFR